MPAEETAPCRHAGVPPRDVVDKVIELIQTLPNESDLLSKFGLTVEECRDALPVAVEAVRGKMSANNTERRDFLWDLLETMRTRGLVEQVTKPSYNQDTVYRVTIKDIGDVAIIQKGCPDGAHSSLRWTAPEWAQETYLWWMCSSLRAEPGEHISKGVGRLRKRFFSEEPGTLDGVIFHNQLCGTGRRPCPKMDKAVLLADQQVPPPCVYLLPEREADATEWNWNGQQKRSFPAILMALFGIDSLTADAYTGQVGFQRRGGDVRTTISLRFGLGRSTTYRS